MSCITIVMYHYVRDTYKTKYPNIKALQLSEFKQQIEYFGKYYKFITISDIYEAVYNNKQLDDNCIYLTFDDGYLDHFTNVYPILKSYNIQGFFSMPAKIIAENTLLDVNKIHYILASADEKKLIYSLYKKLDYYRGKEFDYPSNEDMYIDINKEISRFDNKDVIFIKRILQTYLPKELRKQITDELFTMYVLDNDKRNNNILISKTYMSVKQMNIMAQNGMVFGLHGYEHAHLSNMSLDEMKKDMDLSLEVYDKIQNIIDKKHLAICYPYGSYNNDTLKYAQEKGCVLGFTTKVEKAVLNKENALTLSRFDTNDFYPKKALQLL